MADAVQNGTTFRVTGRLKIELYDEAGNLKDVRDVDNLVVTAGKNWIASRMTSATAAVMGWMGVGSGSAVLAGDTQLGTILGTLVTATGTPNTNSVAYVGTLAAGNGTGSVTEAGIFNGSTQGGSTVMLAHTAFTAIPKGAGDTMTITWTITVN